MATWRSASIVAATLQGRNGRRLLRSPKATSKPRRRLPKDRWIRCGSGVLEGILVDLDGFEPSTFSMPFKKYQSLTDISTRNKRLSTREFGRRWTPRGGFWASGLHVDPGLHSGGLARGVPS